MNPESVVPGAGLEPASPPVGQRLLRAPLLPISPPGPGGGNRGCPIGSAHGAWRAPTRPGGEVAEGVAQATRKVGVAALPAGPGVTNGISAIAGAQANSSPICVLGGRAPELRWGSGSLQEIDHLPFVSPLVKSAETVKDPTLIAA